MNEALAAIKNIHETLEALDPRTARTVLQATIEFQSKRLEDYAKEQAKNASAS